MELLVDIDEADIGAIKVGQKATFTVDAHRGRVFHAEIIQIRLATISSNATSSSVVSYQTVLNVNNDDRSINQAINYRIINRRDFRHTPK